MANRLRLGSLFASLLFVFSFVAVDYADARRGGSFGNGPSAVTSTSVAPPAPGVRASSAASAAAFSAA